MANTYKFENDSPSFGQHEDVNTDLVEFARRLQRPEKADLNLTDRELLLGYVRANHRAADWYNKARDKRRKSRTNYARGRIAVLVLLPFGIYGLSVLWPSEAAVTQATVLLTGLMAAFRASSQWAENTFSASNFAKAASELKERIYAFESEWAGKAFVADGSALAPE